VRENTERDFDTDPAGLKQAQTQLAAPPSAVQTIPFRARPAAPVAAPDSAPAPVTDAPKQSSSHDLAEAFERARKQAEQQAREEAIRIQQEARERRLRDQHKPK
jgi:hypothetical protein